MSTTPRRKLFGTDGVRGPAGSFPLDAPTVRTIGTSLALHLQEKLGRSPLIVTGRDTRESGPWLEQALLDGARSGGADCKSGGVITTPGVAYLVRNLEADAGVVISASHNPYQDNGVKIFSPSGRKLDDETERLIESDIFTSPPEERRWKDEEETSRSAGELTTQLHGRYLDFLADEIGRGLSLKNLRLVIDCAHGAASDLAPQLFERLGARVIATNNDPDGRNINLNCGSLHIESLQQKVVAENADLGVAFDGDADRSLFVDAKGQYVDGDSTLWILANDLQARSELSHGLVVATVMSNIGLEIALRSRGLRLVRTDVGDKYVLDELIRTGASLGGEQSGHVIFPRLSLAGDGMITTIMLLRAMSERGKTLNELTRGFKRYPQILVNVKVLEKRPFEEVESIQNLVRETESRLGDRGRLLLRYSGTEPLARVMIEGESQSEIEALAGDLAALIGKTFGKVEVG